MDQSIFFAGRKLGEIIVGGGCRPLIGEVELVVRDSRFHIGFQRAVDVVGAKLLFGHELVGNGSKAESEFEVGFAHTALHVVEGHGVLGDLNVVAGVGKGEYA